MSRYIPVEPEKWAEMVKALSEVERLRHRIEALREAGDELWYCLRHSKRIDAEEVKEAVEEWQAAKEGKQS